MKNKKQTVRNYGTFYELAEIADFSPEQDFVQIKQAFGPMKFGEVRLIIRNSRGQFAFTAVDTYGTNVIKPISKGK